jgi:hypothetical protein
MLHRITPEVADALGRMSSTNDLIPRHFSSSVVDKYARLDKGRGAIKQGVLCSYYNDMDTANAMLLTDDFMCSMPQLIGLEAGTVSSFSGVAKFHTGQIRKRRYPFSSANVKHVISSVAPAPLSPASSNMISLFSYYTDSWDWSSSNAARDEALADLITFCRTGKAAARTFGFHDPVRGLDGNRLRPLATFPTHMMAFASMFRGKIEVALLPAREMNLGYDSPDLGLEENTRGAGQIINAHVFKVWLKSQGIDYERQLRPGRKPSIYDYC